MRKLLTALILTLLCQPVFAEINNIPDGDVLGKNNMSFCAMGASDGGNYDSLQLDGSKNLYVNPGALDADTDDASILPHPDVVTGYIITATSTTVKASAGDLIKVIIGVAGAASTTAILYNDADCATLPAAFATLDTSATGVWPIGIPFSAGLCVVTDGTPKITVVYR